MKVILTQDVQNLGAAHDIVEVADGYARNFLVPRSLAIPATKSAVSQIDNMKRVGERRLNRQRGAAEGQAQQLEGKTVVIPARVGAAGRLYGSIGTADIAKQIQEDFGIELDRHNILLSEPIRSTGLYPVPVTLHRDVKIQLLVQVGDAPAEGTGAETAGAADADAASSGAATEATASAGANSAIQ